MTATENGIGQMGNHIVTSYPAGDPEHPDWFIYEYEDRRKVLVEVNSESGKVKFIREL